MPRKILHAAENIRGGVGTYLRDLLEMQRNQFGAGVVVAVVPESQSDILRAPEGVEIITFDNRGPRWLSTLRLARRAREVMSWTEPSVVHLHSTYAGLALRPLLRWMSLRGASPRPPVIYCAHGWSFDRQSSFVSRLLAMTLERLLAPWCDAIVCISRHEMRIAEDAGIPPQKLTHIANGVPRESPPAAQTAIEWPANAQRVLFVGRFDRQKGVDILLDALTRLQVSVAAYLVGDSVLGDGQELSLPPNVRRTGWLSPSELAVYYASADVLVVPSRWEGFGLIAAEAMRAGLPVIATRVGGLAEVVEHEVTGLLVEPGSATALVEAICGMRDGRCAAFGKAGRERFLAHFTLDRVHAEVVALYQRLLAQASSETPHAPRAQPAESSHA
jgi:glycosyltransferase involved in cell wall biosynthesis